MNHQQGNKSAGKILSPAALAFAVGLVCWGSVVIAGEPIPPFDVELGKNPGGIVVSGKTDGGGNYQFRKLAPGSYNLCTKGQSCKTVFVGPDGMLKGKIPNSGNMDIRKAGKQPQEFIQIK